MTFPSVESARFDAAARTGTPVLRLPSVNLLSPATLEGLAVRRVRRRLFAAGLVAVVFVGGGWLVQSARLSSAHHRLATEQAATAPLNAELDKLAPVARFYAQLDTRKNAASAAMAAEVLFSSALSDFARRTPAGLNITNLSVTLTPSVVTSVAPPVSPLTRAGITAGPGGVVPQTATPPAAGGTQSGAVTCNRPDPFHPAAIIGCITLSGTAPSRAVVGELVNNLKASQMYADPFVTTTTVAGTNGVTLIQFNGSVGLTGAAVSGRYTDLSWLADPKVLAAAEAMVAAGDTVSNRLAKQVAALEALAKAQAAAADRAKAAADQAAQQAAEQAAAQQLRDAAAAAVAAANAAAANQANNTGKGK